nr:hypothetical protein [Tanacetum cinerariifolium]
MEGTMLELLEDCRQKELYCMHNDVDDLIEHTLIDSSPKFDYLLEEFSGELAHTDPVPLRIEEADFDLEEEIRLGLAGNKERGVQCLGLCTQLVLGSYKGDCKIRP